MENRVIVHIPSSGITFVSGISSSYDETFYDPVLDGIISRNDLQEMISSLNEGLESFWPCSPCYWFGYGCMICTVGLSLYFPSICISEAEKEANNILNNYNYRPVYYDRNITITLKKSCCASYVEISFPKDLLRISMNQSESVHEPMDRPNMTNGNESSSDMALGLIQTSARNSSHGIISILTSQDQTRVDEDDNGLHVKLLADYPAIDEAPGVTHDDAYTSLMINISDDDDEKSISNRNSTLLRKVLSISSGLNEEDGLQYTPLVDTS